LPYRKQLNSAAAAAGSILDLNVPKRFKFSAAGVASLLRTAARLAPVEPTIKVCGDTKDIDIAVELPCFDRATSIKLELGDVKLAPAVAGGEFPLLERLSVAGRRLSTASLILQCPHLRVLSDGARIPELGIPTFTSTKKISYFLTGIDENTIKYDGARPRSCFFYCFRLQ
jgi:hypothetical protein